ncbi:hypothetical protein HY374_03555 [Candidatus Berkelbacteria bacterium]|nr:hypothetical protein [Candidatus Berkelbacteria bacterium]
MSNLTEKLLQVAAAIVILYFGWQIVAQTVVDLVVTKSNLRACQQEVLRLRPPVAPAPVQPAKP